MKLLIIFHYRDRVEYYNFKKWTESACVCHESTNCLGTIDALYVSRLWPPSQDHVAQCLSFSSNGLGILPFFPSMLHTYLCLYISLSGMFPDRLKPT